MVTKLAVLALFIVVALTQSALRTSRRSPRVATTASSTGSSIIFFAYLGFDAVATGVDESRNPGRDLPLAIIASLVIPTVIYVLVAFSALGVATPALLASRDDPLVAALEEGVGITWAAAILAVSAVIALTSVLLVLLYAERRIKFAMCRDGLLPERLAHVNRRYGTPTKITLVLGGLIAILAGLRAGAGDRRTGQHRPPFSPSS